MSPQSRNTWDTFIKSVIVYYKNYRNCSFHYLRSLAPPCPKYIKAIFSDCNIVFMRLALASQNKNT